MLTRTWIHRTIWIALFLMSVCVTTEVEAQLRGGGGHGLSRGSRSGGGGFFRDGMAGGSPLGGNFSSRFQMPGSRQSSPQQLQTRQQTGDATSQVSRQNTAKDLQTRQQASDTANREDWQSHANQDREDRQGYRTETREDWQDYGEPRRDYWENGGSYYGGYYGGYPAYPAGGVATGVAIGSTMTAAAFNAQKASCRTLVVNGVSYYQCGSTWYQPSYQGNTVTYIVVSPPR
ncbi:MAG: hypothetical protein AB7G75_29930 [Candidatus Binatia bacterium]